ncbi:DUF4190 domain-containing protein [Streptomyces sp. T-3]|nr:DUF4190 domain-containing protein [Streptomyces sp. T-3]
MSTPPTPAPSQLPQYPPQTPPQPGSWPPPPPGGPQQRTQNGLAIASFVLSLVCFAPVGLVLGIVALRQIARRGQRGKGLAIAGVVISSVSLVLAAVLVVVGVVFARDFDAPKRDKSTGQVAEASTASLFDLKKGDCFTPGEQVRNDGKSGSIKDISVEIVPCQQPHRGEVIGTFRLTGDSFPGDDQVAQQAEQKLQTLMPDYDMDGDALGDLQGGYYGPDRSGWAAGERTVISWVGPPEGKTKGSIRRDKSTLSATQFAYLDAVKPAYVANNTRPQQGPQEDLAAAKAWAARVADGDRRSAEQLKEAALPNSLKGLAADLAAQIQGPAAGWRTAATASDAADFQTKAAKALQTNSAEIVELTGKIRAGLGLPPIKMPNSTRNT